MKYTFCGVVTSFKNKGCTDNFADTEYKTESTEWPRIPIRFRKALDTVIDIKSFFFPSFEKYELLCAYENQDSLPFFLTYYSELLVYGILVSGKIYNTDSFYSGICSNIHTSIGISVSLLRMEIGVL